MPPPCPPPSHFWGERPGGGTCICEKEESRYFQGTPKQACSGCEMYRCVFSSCECVSAIYKYKANTVAAFIKLLGGYDRGGSSPHFATRGSDAEAGAGVPCFVPRRHRLTRTIVQASTRVVVLGALSVPLGCDIINGGNNCGWIPYIAGLLCV